MAVFSTSSARFQDVVTSNSRPSDSLILRQLTGYGVDFCMFPSVELFGARNGRTKLMEEVSSLNSTQYVRKADASLVAAICVVGFHHLRGTEIEWIHSEEELPEDVL